jgi:protein required for attachment to host cells
MNVLDLLARLGGEILSNKARAVVDGKVVILARMSGDEWVYTDEGQTLANEHSNAAAEEAEAKPKRAKKAPEPVVEAEPTTEAPVAVESPAIAPEL